MKYLLPLAPTTNNLYENSAGGGRHISRKYAAWKQTAGQLLNVQRSRFKALGVKMPIAEMGVVVIYLPYMPKIDLDNRFKATLDLLVSHDILVDDQMKNLVNIQATIDVQLKDDTMAVLVATAMDIAAGEHGVDLEDMETEGDA